MIPLISIQTFGDELTGSSSDMNQVLSAFPSFQSSQSDVSLGFINYNGVFAGWSSFQTGLWVLNYEYLVRAIHQYMQNNFLQKHSCREEFPVSTIIFPIPTDGSRDSSCMMEWHLDHLFSLIMKPTWLSLLLWATSWLPPSGTITLMFHGVWWVVLILFQKALSMKLWYSTVMRVSIRWIISNRTK